MKTEQPVRLAARILGALSVLLGGLPALLLEFEVIAWTASQVAAYGTFLGISIGALALLFGVQVAKAVTPTANPRDDDLVPLAPIADDGYEDELPDF